MKSILVTASVWAVVVFIFAAILTGCTRHDDGMGDLWRGVRQMEQQR